MTNRIFVLLLLIGLSLGQAYSQNINKAKLDSLFDLLAAKDKAMGSVAISKNGTILYSRAIGYSFLSASKQKKATTDTKYRIGSITKTFTATMIFQLIEEGKLQLTTTLDTYFPQLPNAKLITISNLLNHRSGLHSFTSDSGFLVWMTLPKTHEDILSVITKHTVDFQPNEKYQYSNSNYVVLGYILEKIYKKPYPEILKEQICSRIGLTNTYCGGKIDPQNNESFSYTRVADWIPATETDMSVPGGAGSIVSTPADLDRFIEALFSLKLVSAASLGHMKTMTDGYGMGLYQAPFYDKICYGHNGAIDGFKAQLFYLPGDSLAIAYCSNGYIFPINDIMIGALSIYFGKDYNLPTFTALALKTEDLDKYLGVYLSEKLPIKITITKDNTTLIAQAAGQSAFPLDAVEKDKFNFDPSGIKMDFDPDKGQFILRQAGGKFLFSKEK